jgi:ABC-type amino acid transport system permease subunit
MKIVSASDTSKKRLVFASPNTAAKSVKIYINARRNTPINAVILLILFMIFPPKEIIHIFGFLVYKKYTYNVNNVIIFFGFNFK